MSLEKAIEILRTEYERAVKLEWVHSPVAYALYQTWKKADNHKPKRGGRDESKE